MSRLHNYMTEGNGKVVKVVILTSRSGDNTIKTSAEKFEESAKKHDMTPYLVYSEDGYISDDKVATIHNIDDKKGFKIDPDNTVVIARGGVLYTKTGINLLHQLETLGFFCVNTRKSMELCSDKYKSMLMFRKLGIDTPITRIVSSQEKLEVVIDRITTFPVVIKTISGYGGAGVFKIDSVENLRPTLQTIWNISEDEEMLIQDFIESDGDIRIHVLGGEIIAAMKRVKPDDDFRSNYSLGGDIESVEITDKMKNMAILATKESGLSWSGVDIIIDKKNNKPYMVEINGSPGTEGIDKVLKTKSTIDIVLEFIKDKNNWDN